jgi:hypothetical protein
VEGYVEARRVTIVCVGNNTWLAQNRHMVKRLTCHVSTAILGSEGDAKIDAFKRPESQRGKEDVRRRNDAG